MTTPQILDEAPKMLLAIDTATRVASIAVYGADGVHAETTWRSRENHTVELMAQIIRLLALANVAKSELTAIGVALGPGSFTGLRVGMSVAKGMAFAAHLSLFGVPTLDAVAQPHAFQSMPIWAVLGAGRGRYSVARYTAGDGVIHREGDYALVHAAGLADLVSRADDQKSARAGRILLCGEIDAALAELLSARLGERAAIATPAMNLRRAGYLAELAWARMQRGEVDDVQALSPLYTPHVII
jgi:tRNA threonylcarbamoyladenosine biosynthesis protein TsaB